MKLETTLATFSSKAGDPFSARVTEPVVMDGKTVIPIGTTVEGRVTKINEPRRIAGKPTIGIFPRKPGPSEWRPIHAERHRWLTPTPATAPTSTPKASSKAPAIDGKDITEIGMGTGGGMLIGGLADGGKGLLIGGAIGATVTVTHWLGKAPLRDASCRHELVMELNRPMTMTTPASRPIGAIESRGLDGPSFIAAGTPSSGEPHYLEPCTAALIHRPPADLPPPATPVRSILPPAGVDRQMVLPHTKTQAQPHGQQASELCVSLHFVDPAAEPRAATPAADETQNFGPAPARAPSVFVESVRIAI